VHDAHLFLSALTVVLCVAAVTTVVFQRLHQPVVLGYIIAGLIVGPHLPIPLVADQGVVQTLSEFGVILLMFSLGLEFSLRKLLAVGPTAGLTAIVQSSLMIWLGFVIGRLFGWTTIESLFTGAIIAISSTTIIAKAFDEQGVRGRLRELVVGVLIVEDLIAIMLMATLTAVASDRGLSARELLLTTGRLVAFLAGLVVVGLLVVPRAVRLVNRLSRKETTLVANIGICFAIAYLAQESGYSVALGAFIAGSLVAESGEEHEVAVLVEPVRDMFGAIFFVSVGMQIDPVLVLAHWPAIVVLTVAVVLGKVVGVTLGAFLTGNGLRTSVQAGMSLAQIGEFSFIIAGLGLTLQATGTFLYPVAVTVSALTTLLTPWLIRASGPAASWVDRRLPRPLQTFVALYGSWVEKLQTAPRSNTATARIRRILRLLVLDAALLAVIIVGTSYSLRTIARFAREGLGLGGALARPMAVALAVLLSAPFCFGLVRLSRSLGVALAEMAFPPKEGRAVDFADAPRRGFVVAVQLATVLLVGAPLVAVTQPFLPGAPGAGVLALLLAVVGVGFWRSAANLQGHVRAGAQVIVEVLAAQSKAPTPGRTHGGHAPLAQVDRLLPGLGALEAYEVTSQSRAVGRTLAELNLRGLTGATVLAITRAGEPNVVPTATEHLRTGDVLALAGTQEAIAAAHDLLG
jgi:CPA2 family monovalent cation:H+ antiporter-2